MFPEVPSAAYRVEFEQAGFKKNLRKNVTLELNQVLTLNTTMQLARRAKSLR